MNQPSVLEQMNEYIQQSKEKGEELFEFEYSNVFGIVVVKKIFTPSCDENGYAVIQFPKFVSLIDELAWEGLKEPVKAIFRIPEELVNFWPIMTTEIFKENLDMASKAYKFEVEEGHKFYASQEGVLFNKEKTILYAYPSHKTEEEYVIPDTVVLIKEGAFVNNPHLKKLSIHKNVVEIESCQFACSTMIEVDLENTAYQSQEGSLYSKDGKTNYHVYFDEKDMFTEEDFIEVMDFSETEDVVEVEEVESISKDSKVLTEMRNYVVKSKMLGKQLFDFQYDDEDDYIWIEKIREPLGIVDESPCIQIPKFVSMIDTFSYMGNDVIKGSSLYIPKECVIGYMHPKKSYVHWQFGEWLKKIKVDEEHEIYSSQDGVLFNKDKTEILCYPAYKTEEEYVVPETVVRIDYRLFAESTYLKKLVISKNVIEINNFEAWGNIELEVNPDNTRYKSIGGSVYRKDGKIAYYLHDDGSRKYHIEEGTVILKKVYLPDDIKELYLPKSLEPICGLLDILNDTYIDCEKLIVHRKMETFLSKYGCHFEVSYYE